MADVDFSNAVLDVNTGSYRPLNQDTFLGLTNARINNTSGQQIVTNNSYQLLQDTPAKISILYTGSFTSGGSEFCTSGSIFRVSNISFSSGDTYSFIIDVETSGNV